MYWTSSTTDHFNNSLATNKVNIPYAWHNISDESLKRYDISACYYVRTLNALLLRSVFVVDYSSVFDVFGKWSKTERAVYI